MKISIIGAGNVGGQAALHIAQAGLGEVVLVDIVKGLAEAKALDLEDALAVLKCPCLLQGTEDISRIKNSDIVIITAGRTRKPGMTREELFAKNAQIVRGICHQIKELSPASIIIVVTNPLDLMVYLVLQTTGLAPAKVFGMGLTLDASRFRNLISRKLNLPNSVIEAVVIGSHGEGMLPLPRFTLVEGKALSEIAEEGVVEKLVDQTKGRGQKIVRLLGWGSAYFAPALAIVELVKSVAKDEKRILGVSVYLNGEYGVKDICLGVPCILGRNGVEKIIELDLNKGEKEIFLKTAEDLKRQYSALSTK